MQPRSDLHVSKIDTLGVSVSSQQNDLLSYTIAVPSGLCIALPRLHLPDIITRYNTCPYIRHSDLNKVLNSMITILYNNIHHIIIIFNHIFLVETSC